MSEQEKKKKSQKAGRNRLNSQRYTTQARRIRNKIRKLRKHCRRQPNDALAQERLTWDDMKGIRGAVFDKGAVRLQLALATAPL